MGTEGKLGGQANVPGVAGTLMSNLGLEHALARLGIICGRAKVGDRYVLEQMLAHNAALGGEQSGHILLPHLATTDLLLAALWGGAVSGLGMGLVFKGGGNTGGTDIVAQLLGPA